MATVSEERIETAGFETHLLRAGQGNDKAMVLIHGGGPGADARANFQPTLEIFGEYFDVCAPDLAGFGTTERPEPGTIKGMGPWMKLHVEQVLAVIDHVSPSGATLFGNSLGGAVALTATLQSPEKVDAMVLMGSAGPPVEPAPATKEMLKFYSDPTRERLRAILASFVYDLDGFDDLDQIVEMRYDFAVKPEVRQSFEAMFSMEDGQALRDHNVFRDRIGSITQPTLVVHGRQDRIIPVEGSFWLAENLPDADLVVLDRCGHWAMLERQTTFTKAVIEFVEERAPERAQAR
jgi:2-hydroxymuconate-semialdehyde hydrolase